MLLAILGRQPAISLAELESQFGSNQVKLFSDYIATIDTDQADINRFGGILKLAQVDLQLSPTSTTDAIRKITNFYRTKLPTDLGKLTLGISWYQSDISPRTAQLLGLKIKSAMKHCKVSTRLIPNQTTALSTATSHHNQLGRSPKKIEIIVVHSNDQLLIGRSIGVQNISAYRDRDQKRPKRDAKVGMLPPKLAQILINLATADSKNQTILDPFCGTGVVLQEASLLGHQVVGSDKEPRMIDFSRTNLNWLGIKPLALEIGDATKHQWQQTISSVASEIYLGRPFSRPPSQSELNEEMQTITDILTGFLKNIQPQIQPETRLALAVPAWLQPDGGYIDLPIINQLQTLQQLGFSLIHFQLIDQKDLLYHRPNQIVARRLLVLNRD